VLDEDVNDQGAMWLVIIRHAPELNIEIDQNGEVFMNMLQYEPGELEREPCVEDYFAAQGSSAAEVIVASEEVEYVPTGLLQYCAGGGDLTTEEGCRAAAANLGIRWGGSYQGPGDHRFCLHADDGRDAAFFNLAGDLAAVAPPNSNYRSLCRQVAGGAPAPGSLRERVPPRNMLSNTTAALLHFNGPSHEDGVWVTCYHAWSKEFRARGKGHTFFDVDHNVLLSTDDLCDYSWYEIRDFHAHPVHGGILEFLKDFYAMPVDPGLLAWRGSTSAVDATRLGREEDLHASNPRLHGALAAGGDVEV